MTFQELMSRVPRRKPGRLDTLGATPAEKKVLDTLREPGWTVTHHDDDPHRAVTAAVEAASSGKTDLLFVSETDTFSMLRMLERQLADASKNRCEPLTLMEALEVPAYSKVLWVGYTLTVEYDCCGPAIKSVERMARTLQDLGEAAPHIALLSCVEIISAGVPSTIWEAALGKMGDRGQFGKAQVDGPLAFDLAISPRAVEEKGVRSTVPGDADLIVPPDLNSFRTATDVVHVTGAHKAGCIAVGGPVPIAVAPHCPENHIKESIHLASLLL